MSPDMTSIAWWVTQLGFPGVVCFMVWRILLFVKPIILDFLPYCKSVLIGHIGLMTTLEDHAKIGSSHLQKMSEKQDEHTIQLRNIYEALKGEK